MSTCRGCHNDERVPLERGMVTMVVDPYRNGDALVAHRADESRCLTFGETPHRMSECGMFDPPRPEIMLRERIRWVREVGRRVIEDNRDVLIRMARL